MNGSELYVVGKLEAFCTSILNNQQCCFVIISRVALFVAFKILAACIVEGKEESLFSQLTLH